MSDTLQKWIGISLSALLAAVILILLKIAASFVLAVFFRRRTKKYPDRAKRYRQLARLADGIVKTAFWTVLAICILDLTGLNSVTTALITFAGIGSLVVGLAAQDIFKDVIAGFILITEGKIAHDDWVKINGYEGAVEEIKLRNVYLRTYTGQLVAIPSGEISVIENYARGRAKAMVEVNVPFSADVEKAREAIMNAGKALKAQDKNVLTDPVIAGITELTDASYRVRVYVETDGPEFWQVQREFNELILKSFRERGIDMTVPAGVKLYG